MDNYCEECGNTDVDEDGDATTHKGCTCDGGVICLSCQACVLCGGTNYLTL